MIPFITTNTTQYQSFDPINYVSKPRQKVEEPEIVLDPETEKIRRVIKYMESRGYTDPNETEDGAYKAINPASKENYGDALGAYQIKEATLSDNAMRFLGKRVTKDEFLNSPELQDQFIRAEIKYLQDAGYKTNSLFAAHHGGWSDQTRNATINRNTKYEKYMNDAMKQYDSLTQEEQKELEKVVAKPDEKKSGAVDKVKKFVSSMFNKNKIGSEEDILNLIKKQ
jgi:hypothetical protein